MLGFSTSKPDAQTVPTVRPLDAEVLWEAIQSWRQSEGLPKYQKDEGLCRIATNRVSDGIDNHKGLYEKYGDYSSVIQENSNDGYHSEKDSLGVRLEHQTHQPLYRISSRTSHLSRLLCFSSLLSFTVD